MYRTDKNNNSVYSLCYHFVTVVKYRQKVFVQDDIISYIQQNIVPIYDGKNIDLLVLKKGAPLTSPSRLVTGDLVNPDKIKYGYVPQPNFSLTQRTALTYQFEYTLEANQNYSLTFNFKVGKI